MHFVLLLARTNETRVLPSQQLLPLNRESRNNPQLVGSDSLQKPREHCQEL